MARSESDHENLMRDAVGLVSRIELRLPGAPEHVFVGYYRDGRLAMYFGRDPVYQFDDEGRLRRAFVGGRLFRSQGRALSELTRVRTPVSTDLLRRDLSPAELDHFWEEMRARLRPLRDALSATRPPVVRQIPEGASLLPRLAGQLDSILAAPGTLAPAVNTKR